MIWTPNNVDKLMKLSNTNLTATQISIELGTTKNAVLGKLHREKIKKGYKVKKQTRGASHNFYFKTIGRGTCNLCQKQFDIQSKFDRFCMPCKKTDMYVGS